MAKGTVFSLSNLRLLDFGKIGVAFDHEIERVVKDCLDRPSDDHARTVTIKFSFEPTLDPSAGMVDCETVAVECEVSSAVPKRRTKVYEMRPHKNGQLSFNPDLPDEPEEETLYHEAERKEDSNE